MTRFKIVNQNQYPRGLTEARYFAPKWETISMSIDIQSRCIGEIATVDISASDIDDAISRFGISGFIN